MNFQRKQAAINKFKPMVENQIPKEELKQQIIADEKGYTEDEANEIIEALFEPSGDSNNGNFPPPPPVEVEKVNHNKKYEEFPVKLITKATKDENGQYSDSSFEKTALNPNRTTHITPERAAELNAQSHNTLVRYYEVV